LAPSVSVLMPVRNAQPYLGEAVASILGQSHADLELVAVDDGSSDGSSELIAELARGDDRMRVVPGPGRGVAAAANAGLAACRGPLVARMDADDLSLPRRLEIQLAHLAVHPDCVALGGQADLIDEDGDPLGWILNPLDHEGILAALRRSSCEIVNCSSVMRLDAARAVSGYREGVLGEDIDLFLRLAERGRLANVPEHVLRVRKHSGSLTAQWSSDEVDRDRRERAVAAGARADDHAPWRREPTGEARDLARMGLAIHARFDATARKYRRRLLAGARRRPLLLARLASRALRSYAWRWLAPLPVPRR